MSHIDTIRSYEAMEAAAGRHAANARLSTPLGVQHCGGGPGANRFDMIADPRRVGREGPGHCWLQGPMPVVTCCSPGRSANILGIRATRATGTQATPQVSAAPIPTKSSGSRVGRHHDTSITRSWLPWQHVAAPRRRGRRSGARRSPHATRHRSGTEVRRRRPS